MQIKFWGVRGSHAVPGPDTLEFGGNTPCVQITAGDHLLILDAGTGIIGLGKHLAAQAAQTGQPVTADILFSHYHHDHIEGYPFFVPAYMPNSRLTLYGPTLAGHTIETILIENQRPPLFPVTFDEMRANIAIHTIQDGETLHLGGGEIVIYSLRSYAHPGGVFMYRIEYAGQAVVYATDIEGYIGTDRRLVAFAQGADLLIHDAQYSLDHYQGQRDGCMTTQGFGHSTALMACEVAEAAGVQQLVLFHHDPSYTDDIIRQTEIQARAHFAGAIAGYDGLTITLQPERDHERDRDRSLSAQPALADGD